MKMLGECFFQMSNSIFYYGLTPDQLTVYCYLVCLTGQKEYCWPSVKTIAACCGISEKDQFIEWMRENTGKQN